MLDILLPKLHKEGHKFVTISLIITFVFLLISKALGLIGLVVTVWVFYFFRDPDRYSIQDNNYLVSPADGIISQITEVEGPKELNMESKKFTRISVFMNVFDCHVNRLPVECTVKDMFYKPGKFLNASLDKASEENERNYLKILSQSNDEMALVQIAGLVARRIVVSCSKEQSYKQGDRFGLIRFGSRVDLYIPKNFKILAKKGQAVTAGESLFAIKN
ncbi:MAG: phosphatidylserine decarboxylase family protein [Candidatus Pelagibacter sp.]|nr:phosphatidylserine decarboxylase family protein [Candidatus Pelagibacter sp.]MAJ57982.1 phosphatidylserine decarboxylase family protein [Candidatus Pelagibacter sp.]